MKKFITIAALLAAGTALSDATEVSYTNLFDDADAWTMAVERDGRGSFSIADGTLSLENSNWGQASAGYTFGSTLSLQDGETLNFSVAFTAQNLNGTMSIALVGTSSVFVFGKDYNENYISYGKNDNTSARFYTFDTEANNWGGSAQIGVEQNRLGTTDTVAANTPLTISGTVAYSGSSYTLALSDGTTTANVDLGSSFDLARISILGDGANSTPNFSLTNLSVAVVPEPSAFGLLAGVGALALVAARRWRSRK